MVKSVKLTSLTQEIYKPNDIAKLLDCHRKTIQRYCDQGIIKCTYIGNRNERRVSKNDLITFLIDEGLLYDDGNVKTSFTDLIYIRDSVNDSSDQFKQIFEFLGTQNISSLEVIKDDKHKNEYLFKIFIAILKKKVNRIFILSKSILEKYELEFLQFLCDHYKSYLVIVDENNNI